MRTCRQSTDNYILDDSQPDKEPTEKYKVTYTPTLPEIVEDTQRPKDMEAAWESMDNEPDSTVTPSHNTTSEDIVSKNTSAIESMRRNIQIFRNVSPYCVTKVLTSAETCLHWWCCVRESL